MDNAVNCIKGEIHNVIASLRLGWAAQIPFLADFKVILPAPLLLHARPCPQTLHPAEGPAHPRSGQAWLVRAVHVGGGAD